ncbi:MAG: RNA polymerase factor sigma-54 [bacterium]
MAGPSLALLQQQRQMMILAPQLRQSLEMLQLPMLELRAVIQEEMETNPTIEDVTDPHEVSVDAEQPATVTADDDPLDFDKNKDIDALAKLDEEWRDYFLQGIENAPHSEDAEERHQFLLDSVKQPVSLQDHLLEQITLTALSDPDKQFAETLIGNINDDGYFTGNLEELAMQMGCNPHHLHDILSVVQEFHPTGVGARDVRECLLLQLESLGDSPQVRLARRIVEQHLDDLAGRRHRIIAKELEASPEEVQEAEKFIRALDPRPGRIFSPELSEYVTPEVMVKRISGRYTVILDDDQLPHIRISAHYRQLLQDPGTTAEVKSYIRERIRAGAFLIKSIHQRQRTIHRIATEIVNAQQDFLDQGIAHLRPMTMAEVAAKVGVHETTVSRTVANKYMTTPRGVFELKFFFTPGLRTSTGASVSNKTVQDRIAHLVAEEPPADPLSDQAIQEKLELAGIHVARRTVAKYRIILKIPPSHQRRHS